MHARLQNYCERLLSEGTNKELLDEIKSSLGLGADLNEWQIIDELLYRLNTSTFENSLMNNMTRPSK
jgi:hypothetical protein